MGQNLKSPSVCFLISIGFLISVLIIISAEDEPLKTKDEFEGRNSRFDNSSEDIPMISSDHLKWHEETTVKEVEVTTRTSTPTTVMPNESGNKSNTDLVSLSSTTTTSTTTVVPLTVVPDTTSEKSTTTFPRLDLDGDVYEDVEEEDDIDPTERNRRTFHGGGRRKESWFDRIKNLFRPNPANSVLAHAMQGGTQFREKYGSSPSGQQSLYGGGGGDGYSGPPQGGYHHPAPLVPDGAFAPIYKPAVSLHLSADFIELNCAAHGRIQHGIRWVKIVGLNNYGHQLFATVADGDRILFDTYHFGVRTDGRNSRLIIRNPDPKIHYGVYQCQASVAGNPSIIVKEDFVVGRVK